MPEPKLAGVPAAEYCAECLAISISQTPSFRDQALEILINQPPSESRASAISGVLAVWVRQDSLEKAASWLDNQKFQQKELIKIATSLAVAAAHTDNTSAADWLKNQLHQKVSSKHKRANALHTFTEEWARERPTECATWLTLQEPSYETDWGIRGFLKQVKHIDPATGFHWTRKIKDPKGREKKAWELWSAWRRHAPESAANFINRLEVQELEWLNLVITE